MRARLEEVKDKRPKMGIDHILQYGYITNIDLNQKYGYDHPPRAIRDVRELGIPPENFKVPGPGKKMITAYRKIARTNVVLLTSIAWEKVARNNCRHNGTRPIPFK